jgi:hypothetical protein
MSQGAHSSSQSSSNALVYFFGALGGMLFGYDTGVISGAILFIKADLGLNAFYQGLVVSSLLLGAMAGAGTAGPLSDRLGRRRIIIIAAIVFTVGALGAALAPNVAVLVLFRIVLGVAGRGGGPDRPSLPLRGGADRDTGRRLVPQPAHDSRGHPHRVHSQRAARRLGGLAHDAWARRCSPPSCSSSGCTLCRRPRGGW